MKDFVVNLFSGSLSGSRKQNVTRPIDKNADNDQHGIQRTTDSEQMEVEDGIETSLIQFPESEAENSGDGHVLHGKKSLKAGKEHCESSDTGDLLSEEHCRSCDRRENEVVQLQKSLKKSKKQLKSTQSELMEAQQRMNTYKQNEDSMQRYIQQSHNNARSAERRLLDDVEHARSQWRDADGKRMQSEDENRWLREKLSSYEHDHKEMTQLLEERTADIKGAQVFLTAADLHSGADIINMVEGLNEGIFQLAAYTAELVEDDTMTASEEERDLNMQACKKWLDVVDRWAAPELSAYLAKNPSQVRDNPLPLQLIIQQLIASWCTLESQIVRARLKDLYNGIKLQETQAVTGRWRALTNLGLSQTREEGNNSEDDTLLSTIFATLYLCGWSSSSTKAEKVTKAMRKMISGFEKQQQRLKRAIAQEVTTADMEVFIYERGDAFLPDAMENTYEEKVRGSPAGLVDNTSHVLCTVGMGLRKSVTNKGEQQTNLLLKAQVVLKTILLDFNPGTEEMSMPQD